MRWRSIDLLAELFEEHPVDERRLLRADQRDRRRSAPAAGASDARRAPDRRRSLDLVHDDLGLARVELVALAPAVRDVDVDERRIEPLLRRRDAQRHQRLGIEGHREADDRLDAAEMLLQHHELVGEHHLGEVVERGARQQQRLERLPLRKPCSSRSILAVSMKAAVGLTCLSSPTTRIFLPRRSAGSSRMSDCEASSMITRSKEASSAGQLLGDAPGRHDPAGDGVVALAPWRRGRRGGGGRAPLPVPLPVRRSAVANIISAERTVPGHGAGERVEGPLADRALETSGGPPRRAARAPRPSSPGARGRRCLGGSGRTRPSPRPRSNPAGERVAGLRRGLGAAGARPGRRAGRRDPLGAARRARTFPVAAEVVDPLPEGVPEPGDLARRRGRRGRRPRASSLPGELAEAAGSRAGTGS